MLILRVLEKEDEDLVMRNILSLKHSYIGIYINPFKERSSGLNAGFNFKNCMGDIVDLFRRTYVLNLLKH
jgi:hypothetical protein